MFSSIQEEIQDTIINVCTQREEIAKTNPGKIAVRKDKECEKALKALNKALEAAKNLGI